MDYVFLPPPLFPPDPLTKRTTILLIYYTFIGHLYLSGLDAPRFFGNPRAIVTGY